MNMSRSFKERIGSGGIVLSIGIALLIFTFISSYLFLKEDLQIISSADFVQTFGSALAPLISTCIRVMYLGVMGWLGSIITIRGVTLMSAPKTALQAPLAPAYQPMNMMQQPGAPIAITNAPEPQPEMKAQKRRFF
jgi:hypothetical protein